MQFHKDQESETTEDSELVCVVNSIVSAKEDAESKESVATIEEDECKINNC